MQPGDRVQAGPGRKAVLVLADMAGAYAWVRFDLSPRAVRIATRELTPLDGDDTAEAVHG